MSVPVSVSVEAKSLDRLNDAIVDYALTTGKTNEEVLATKGEFVSRGLYQGFMRETPARGSILAAAKARGWRMGRKVNSLGGISHTAWKRAMRWMGSSPSILARVSESNGKLLFRGVRVGSRGRFIVGGRRGNKGEEVSASSAVGVYANSSKSGVRLKSAKYVGVAIGAKTLGRRAVGVAMEVNLREAGRRFLGISWLQKNWRRIRQERVLVNRNPRGQIDILGDAKLETNANGQTVALRLTSNVPGVAQIGQSRGIFARVLSEEVVSTQAYLLRKQIERLRGKLAPVKSTTP